MNRQESLFAILPRAKEAAAEASDTIYVIRCKGYVDEFEEGEHVFGTKAACAYLFPKFEALGGEIEASVDDEGSVFFVKMEDVLASIEKGVGKFKEIKVSPETYDTIATHFHNKAGGAK